jgi:hypothetical protein
VEACPASGRDRAAADLYDLRHTYATFALRAGVPVFALSRFMGTKHRDGNQNAFERGVYTGGVNLQPSTR